MSLISGPDTASRSSVPGRRGVLAPGVRYGLSRLLSAVGTFIFVILFNFFLFRLLPGDPISLYTRGRDVDPEIKRQLQARFNAPIGEQFFAYIKNPFVPELPSQRFSAPVWDVIGPRIWPTLLLVGTATVLATVFGVWLGIRSAWKRGQRFDKIATTVTLVLYSMPEFWFGMILLIVFSVGVFGIPGIFPVGGLSTPGVDIGTLAGMADVAWHLALPVFTLTVIYLAEYSLVMRASLIDEMGADYLRTARAKGLREADVRRRHAVPNALLPTTTLIFLNLGFVVGGAITIEYVFSVAGLGSLTVLALRGPDIPLLQTLFLLFSAAVIVANLVADLLYARLDPRVRT
ncbi:MAG: ABC transporter permease [Mycobacteriaceae bacterium]|jgi:peptide/nickel transport system permease protein